MNRKLRAILGITLLAAAGGVQAASLHLVPSSTTVTKDQNFTMNLVLDASDVETATTGLFGGEIVINFNPSLLQYNGFTLASGLSFFVPASVGGSGSSQTVTLGFDNAPRQGVVGTFSFKAKGNPGSLATVGLADADDLFGTFVEYAPTYQAFTPTFTGASVSVVPLPAAAWLLLGGVGALGLRARRRA